VRDGNVVPLTPKVGHTLLLLVERRGNLITREELIAAVWPDTVVEEANVSHNIWVLRKTLGEDEAGRPYIETVPKRGYRFLATVRDSCEAVAANEAVPKKPHPRSTARWAVGAGITLLLGFLVAVSSRTGSRAQPEPKLSHVTTHAGSEFFPTFSPAGERVAFTWNGGSGDGYELYVQHVGGDIPTRLTSGTGRVCYPAWSPDGRWIAFLQCAPASTYTFTNGKAELMVISAEGGNVRRLGEIEIFDTVKYPLLAWTGDSRALILVDRFALSVQPLDGSARRLITESQPSVRGDSSPAVSPDGRRLAFVRNTSYEVSDVYLVELSPNLTVRGNPRRLTSEGARVNNVMFGADGHDVFYTVERQGNRTLRSVPATGSGASRTVHLDGPVGLHASISRTGTRIAYVDGYQDRDIWRQDLTLPPGSPVAARRLVSSTRLELNPQISPDGRHIAFSSERSGNLEIWTCEQDGSNPVRLTSLHKAGTPRWSPDGKQIVFDSTVDGNPDIYTVAATGGSVRKVTNEPGPDQVPSWSRDGRWIYFSSNRSGVAQIWKIPAVGTDAVQVTQLGGLGGFESADGRWLYYAKNKDSPTSVWRVPTSGGEEHELIRAIQYWVHFAVVGEHIYFVPPMGEANGFTVQSFSPQSRQTQTVASIVGQRVGFGFSMSPDRRWFLFAPGEFRGGDLVLVENFR
jgi:Tol biopolymer transport system component/DNA-binding winged helix-turn-helix (wHTH) protein